MDAIPATLAAWQPALIALAAALGVGVLALLVRALREGTPERRELRRQAKRVLERPRDDEPR